MLRSALLLRLLTVLRATLRVLPARVSVTVGRATGRIAGAFCARERKIIRAQLALVRATRPRGQATLDLPPTLTKSTLGDVADDGAFASRVFASAGESIVETFLIDRLLSKGSDGRFLHVDTDGQENVQQLTDTGQGAVALSAHLGCFELLAAFHAAWGARVTVIGRVPNYDALDKELRRLRASYGVETVWRNETGSARKIMAALKSGRVVAALIDQDTALESRYSSFFGYPAATPVALIRFALRLRAPILCSFIVRTSVLHHIVVTRRVAYEHLSDPAAAEAHVLDRFHHYLEELIQHSPEQWIWWHRRWRRKERSVEVPSTASYLEWLADEARPRSDAS